MKKSLNFFRKTALVSSALLVTSCSTLLDLVKTSFQLPKVNINSFAYNGVNAQKISFKLLMNVNNPNAIGIKTSGLDYNLNLNNADIIAGNLSNGLDISANGSSNLEIPIEFDFQKMLQIAPSILSNPNNLNYKVFGALNFNTPVGNVPINWRKEDKLDVQQLLSIIPQLFLKN